MIEIYDIDSLKATIEQFIINHELDTARGTYLECIMDWTDHYTENLLISSNDNTNEREIALKSLSQIWIDYANMETSQRQYKKAVLIFEKALEDPIAKTLPDIYLAYSLFCENRGKLPNARNVLIKGVTNQLPSSSHGCDRIWLELLSIMHKSGSENLSLQLLLDAIKFEKGETVVTMPTSLILPPINEQSMTMMNLTTPTPTPPNATANAIATDSIATSSTDIEITGTNQFNHQQQQQQRKDELILENSYIESKENDENDNDENMMMTIASSSSTETPLTITGEEVVIGIETSNEHQQDYPNVSSTDTITNTTTTTASSTTNKANIDMMTTLDVMQQSKLTPEQLNKKYATRPSMLFHITEADMTNFRFDPQELSDLQAFLGEPLIVSATTLLRSGGMMSGSSGSSVSSSSGITDGASSNGQHGVIADTSTTNTTATSSVNSAGSLKLKNILNVLEALWTIQALKERHFNAWFYQLQELQLAEERKFLEDSSRDNPSKRLKITATIPTTTSSSSSVDMKLFENHCQVQLELIQSSINYTLIHLLLEQEMILNEFGLPRFTSSSSLSFIQQFKSLIASTTSNMKYDTPQISEIISQQKRMVVGLLLIRLNPMMSNVYKAPREVSLYLSSCTGTTMNTASMSSHNIMATTPYQHHQQQLYGSGGSEPLSDYYSYEAKTRRRKRRMLDINNNTSSSHIQS